MLKPETDNVVFSIGELEKITGIKAHVLRYWETVSPLISPQKDARGNRSYGLRDIDFIVRLDFLITQKNLSIQEATETILKDTLNPKLSAALRSIAQMRADLLLIYKILLRK